MRIGFVCVLVLVSSVFFGVRFSASKALRNACISLSSSSNKFGREQTYTRRRESEGGRGREGRKRGNSTHVGCVYKLLKDYLNPCCQSEFIL